ncbi:MAG: hypothetical protein KDD34_09975, partial [Bdellovibrionales bacterium]|nr:hypothetical protein [Bdellovibrionales bacterium]
MQKKVQWIICLFVFCFCFQSLATLGAVDGGGGKSVVCRNENGEITSAEVLDLYEGRVQYGYSTYPDKQPALVQAREVIRRIVKGRGERYVEYVDSYVLNIDSNMVLLPDGTGLKEINDSYHVIVPKYCKVEQLANFTPQNQVLVDGEIWRYLDNTNKAALLAHEALYKVFRDFGATNSIRARKAVAIGFARGESEDISEGIPQNSYECHTEPNENGSPF